MTPHKNSQNFACLNILFKILKFNLKKKKKKKKKKRKRTLEDWTWCKQSLT
jgi:folate-dependent tRNA-U54 methylase TrmFO/GidA